MSDTDFRVTPASPRAWYTPAKTAKTYGRLKLTPGLHLMIAPKAAGKTLTSLALALEYQATQPSCPTVFAYVMEPRAANTTKLLMPGMWEAFLRETMASCEGKGVVFIDSLTYVFHKLAAVEALSETMAKVTYSGGLTPRDNLAALILDDMAREAGVALVGTLNSELFPVAEKLEGACEGAIMLTAPGVFTIRNRATRKAEAMHVDVTAAAARLGYPLSPLKAALPAGTVPAPGAHEIDSF